MVIVVFPQLAGCCHLHMPSNTSDFYFLISLILILVFWRVLG